MKFLNILRIVLFFVVLFSLIVCANKSYSLQMQWDLDYEFTDASNPSGPAPWVSMIFDDSIIPDSILLTVKSNLVETEFVNLVLLNVDPSIELSQTDLRFLSASTSPEPIIGVQQDSFHSGADGWYDISLDFYNNSSNRFNGTEAMYVVFENEELSLDSFMYTSVLGPTQFLCAAHIGSIGDFGEESGWITAGTENTPVPEPSSLILLVSCVGFIFTIRKGLYV